MSHNPATVRAYRLTGDSAISSTQSVYYMVKVETTEVK